MGDVRAEDLALVLANRAYDNAPYVRESATAIEMTSALKQAGFRVFEAREQTAAGLRAMAGQF
ncbi:MAG TPA: hypothetical protein VLA45_19435, partial [Paracoccaceae bacterium]|nr:hypothetical protein [Paracoccaceae bacterium]